VDSTHWYIFTTSSQIELQEAKTLPVQTNQFMIYYLCISKLVIILAAKQEFSSTADNSDKQCSPPNFRHFESEDNTYTSNVN